MSGQLERSMWKFRRYISDAETKKTFDELYAKVVEQNSNNFIAFLPVGQVDIDTLDVSELHAFDDYEIVSGDYTDEDGNEWSSKDEYREHLKSLYVIENEGDEEEEFVIYKKFKNDELEEIESCSSEEEAEERLDEIIEDLVDELEHNIHEVYWNIVWCYNGEINHDVANDVGLGVLEHQGNEYVFLLGCGMDLTPKLIAYQALALGYVDESYLSYFEGYQLKYTQHVMGKSIFNKVIKALGIEKFFKEDEHKDNE